MAFHAELVFRSKLSCKKDIEQELSIEFFVWTIQIYLEVAYPDYNPYDINDVSLIDNLKDELFNKVKNIATKGMGSGD